MLKPHRLAFSILWPLVGCLLYARPAQATVVLPAEFSEMVDGSETIVHGRVVYVRSQMTAGRTTIESLVTLAVIESLKGTPVSAVTFRTPTGQVGRYRRILVGAPEFEEGDEVVVFLRGSAPMLPSVFGLNQGVYRVSRNADRALVTPVPVVGGSVAARIVRGDPARRPVPIDDFVREVRAVAARRR